MATTIFGLGLAFAAVVVFIRFAIPGSPICQYLIPQFLSKGTHPKALLREAGIGWIIFTVWLGTITISLLAQLPRQTLEDHSVVMSLLAFVIPVTVVMLHIVGWYYLIIGVFSRTPSVRPGLRSANEDETDQLDRDMRRLTTVATINMVALLFAGVVPVTEALCQVEPTGTVILPNVAALITFILTLGRIRYYLVRTTNAMMSGDQDVLMGILNRRSIWLAWYDAYELRRYYETFKRCPQAPSQPKLSDLEIRR